MKLFGTKINLSIFILVASGILLFIGLSFLPQGNSSVWLTAKAIYAVGVILFLFDK